MGFCSYQHNPSELYRRTKPGTAPETICGARTFPAVDEPEIVVVKTGMGPDGAVYEYRPTGACLARAQDDPYCPEHGGSPPPPPPPVSVAELEHAWSAYQLLSERFASQEGGAIATPAAPPAALTSAPAHDDALAPLVPGLVAAPGPEPVTAGDLATAAAHLQDLAARAGEPR
jgi:hypothetical protein